MKKRIRHITSLTFWYSFLSYALITFILAASVFGFLQHQNLQESQKRSQAENLQLIKSLRSSADTILSNQLVTANALRSIDWISRFYVDSPVFKDYFSFAKQRELAGLLQLSSSNQMTKALFIIFPYRDACVSNNIWVSIQDYFGMLRIPAQEQSSVLDEIKNVQRFARLKTLTKARGAGAAHGTITSPVISLCAPLETISHPRAYVVSLLSTDLFATHLSNQLTGALCGLDIVDTVSGETIITISKNKPDDLIEPYVKSSAYIDLDYHIYLNPDVYSVTSDNLYAHSLPFALLLFFICIAASYGLAYITYLPLGRLTAHMRSGENGRTLVHDYRLLGSHLDAIRMQQEEDRRLNALRSLLTSPVGGISEELSQCGLPFTDDMWYQVYLISSEADSQEMLAAEALAIDRETSTLNCTGLALDNSTYAIIIACDAEDEMDALDHTVQNRLAALGGNIYVGQPGAGFAGASIVYQSAQDKRAYSPRGGIRYYFPLEWESQFITALRSGNEENVLLICGNLRKENARRRDAGQMDRSDMLHLLFTLHNDLQRVATESGRQDVLPAGMMTFAGKRTKEIWAEFERVCVMLCRKHAPLPSADSGDLTAQLIRYTQEHFSDPGLSLTTLEGEFSISSSTVNKCFKAADGSTFYAYLTRIRMEHACRMLLRGGISIAELARSCGYENEYSFRRTFQRTQGVKAQDYAATQRGVMQEEEST